MPFLIRLACSKKFASNINVKLNRKKVFIFSFVATDIFPLTPTLPVCKYIKIFEFLTHFCSAFHLGNRLSVISPFFNQRRFNNKLRLGYGVLQVRRVGFDWQVRHVLVLIAR